jgi:ABC-type Fe3+/spermidine/putrescine transport system ATPase subunit
VSAVAGGTLTVETPLRAFQATSGGDGWQPKAGDACTLSIRPESWKLSPTDGAPNSVAGRIADRTYLGEMAQYRFNAGPQTLKIFELNPKYVELSPEQSLFASAEAEDVVALPG